MWKIREAPQAAPLSRIEKRTCLEVGRILILVDDFCFSILHHPWSGEPVKEKGEGGLDVYAGIRQGRGAPPPNTSPALKNICIVPIHLHRCCDVLYMFVLSK